MKINYDKINNSLDCSYDEYEKFDKMILVNHEAAFQELNPDKIIIVNLSGFIPVPIIVYVFNVSKFCVGIHLKINNDYEAFKYCEELLLNRDSDIKITLENFKE